MAKKPKKKAVETKEYLRRGYVELPKELMEDFTWLGKITIGWWMMIVLYALITVVIIVGVICYIFFKGFIFMVELFLKPQKV